MCGASHVRAWSWHPSEAAARAGRRAAHRLEAGKGQTLGEAPAGGLACAGWKQPRSSRLGVAAGKGQGAAAKATAAAGEPGTRLHGAAVTHEQQAGCRGEGSRQARGRQRTHVCGVAVAQEEQAELHVCKVQLGHEAAHAVQRGSTWRGSTGRQRSPEAARAAQAGRREALGIAATPRRRRQASWPGAPAAAGAARRGAPPWRLAHVMPRTRV